MIGINVHFYCVFIVKTFRDFCSLSSPTPFAVNRLGITYIDTMENLHAKGSGQRIFAVGLTQLLIAMINKHFAYRRK